MSDLHDAALEQLGNIPAKYPISKIIEAVEAARLVANLLPDKDGNFDPELVNRAMTAYSLSYTKSKGDFKLSIEAVLAALTPQGDTDEH